MRITKAFFAGVRGRLARRSLVRRAIGAQVKTGLEHGFHAGRAGVDRGLIRGKPGGIKWPARAAVGQMMAGGDLHHTHPKESPHLSRQDLRAVVTSPNSGKGRNTLWAHSETGHQAAKLTRAAAALPVPHRRKAFNEAYHATKGPGSALDHARRLRQELKRRGIIHSSSRFRKGRGMSAIGRAAERLAKVMVPSAGAATHMLRSAGARRFEEAKHPRTRGKFARKPGGKASPKPDARHMLGDSTLARAAGLDAGNRSMKRGGRTAWNEADRDAATAAHQTVMNGKSPAKPKAKRPTSIRAQLEARIARAPADVPKNAIPAGVKLEAARPSGADTNKVHAHVAAKDEVVTTSWGAKLRARAGKDMILENSPQDRWVIRNDLFKRTYKKNEDGSFSKNPRHVAGFWIAPKAMTIKTLEGPVEAAAGDHVMVGAIGEMWPVKPDKFASRYKRVRLRKANAAIFAKALALDAVIASSAGANHAEAA